MTAHMQSALWAIDQVGDLDEGSAAGRAAISAHS